MHNYSPSPSESNSSFLNQNLDPVKSSNSTAKRRFSLQNPLSPMPTPALTKFNPNDTFVDHTNLNEMRKISGGPFPANLAQYQSPPVSYDPTSTYSKFLFHQQQQQQSQLQQLQQKQRQQQAAQNQENFSNFVKLCNYSGIDLNTDLNNNENSFFSGYSNASTSDSYSISSSQSSLSSQPGTSMFGAPNPLMSKMSSSGQQSLQQQLNRRRCSYGPSASSLHTVMESRSSSPFVPPPLDSPSTYLDPQLEKKLNLLINSNLLASEPAPSAKSIRGSTNSLTTLTTDKSRNRAMSTGSSVGSYDITGISNKLIFNDPFEEKLATTGNIFEKREDWSVLSRIPIAKQNTIHIRLEDEGPYGNDETRCFVLSHFSSLGIKQLKCVFCSCDLIVYDRFPLIDGTLFLSPVMYDQKKSIAATIGNKQHFINAICLGCLLGEPGHEIVCKFCQKSFQSLNGFSVQLGTLYKYDLFAAFPCCRQRLTCKKCDKVMADLNASESFSSYSDERECPSCRTRAHHFIKPLSEIFQLPKCHQDSN